MKDMKDGVQESRRNVSDKPANVKSGQRQRELQKKNLKSSSSTDVSELLKIDQEKMDETIDPIDHSNLVIDKNDDSSSTFSENENL